MSDAAGAIFPKQMKQIVSETLTPSAVIVSGQEVYCYVHDLSTLKQIEGGIIMKDRIIIYGTDTWPFCNQAREAYGDRAVYINVNQDPKKLKEMLVYSGGKMQVPVIVEGDKVRIGFIGDISLRNGIPLFGGAWEVK